MPRTISDLAKIVEKGPCDLMRIVLAFILYRMTTDFVVGAGLVIVLFTSVIMENTSTELQTTIASGLVGFLGRSMLDEVRHARREEEKDAQAALCGTAPSKEGNPACK